MPVTADTPEPTRFLFVRLACAVAAALTLLACARFDAGPPETRIDAVIDTLHGIAVPDPYRWLEDPDSRATRRWIEAQNAYTLSFLGRLPGRAEIAQRAAELMRVEAATLPIVRGERRFFMRRSPDQARFVIYMNEGEAGVDQKLIDPHNMSEDQRTTIELMDVSRDGGVVTYAVRQGGEDEIEIRFFDVASRADLPERLPRARYFGASLLGDRSGVYYARMDSAGPRVWFHAANSPPMSDRLIFGDGYGTDKIMSAAITDDENWLGIVVFHGAEADRTEVHYMDLRHGGPVRTLVNDIPARFLPTFAGDHVILQTNWNAPNGRILRVSLARPDPADWKEIVAESDAVLEGVSAAAGRLVVTRWKDVHSELSVHDLDGTQIAALELPAVGSLAGVSGRWREPDIYYAFASFHFPPAIFRYDTDAGATAPWFTPRVPVDPAQFEVREVFFNSRDGTRVPMFLVHRKDLQRNGQNPVLLTGFGGFNASLTPFFTPDAVIVAERGGVYAVANVRGGGEYGDEWHKAGMLANKQNVFDDFVAAAEWLIAERYTSATRLGIMGSTNGGLLVAAAMTQRPDLFAAVICQYPLLDMLRYHRFLTTPYWVAEYGSADSAEQFAALRAYSPYHNVRDNTAYPAVLFITGDDENGVAPLHARKMTARLQAATSSDKPVLLIHETQSGSEAGAPAARRIGELAAALQFFIWQTSGPRGVTLTN
jgi:prolyl oligopeptidase